jgi:hypothetical protein
MKPAAKKIEPSEFVELRKAASAVGSRGPKSMDTPEDYDALIEDLITELKKLGYI